MTTSSHARETGQSSRKNAEVSVRQSPAIGQRFWTLGLLLIVMWAACAPRSIQSDGVKKAEDLNARVLELREAGRFAEAIPLAQEVLMICKAMLGPRHPSTATSLNNLAYLYLETGAYTNAQPLMEEALAVRKAVLGLRHPDTAVSLDNLADLYLRTGAYANAQPLYEEALSIFKELLGPRHPTTAVSLNNLARLHGETGAYLRAQALMEEALAIRKEVLGARHPATATSLNDLAVLYRMTGAYLRAQALMEEALAIRKEVLGVRHPATATSLHNLADLYFETGAFGRAQRLYEEALAISREVLGLRHPETAATLNNLARVYTRTGTYVQAQRLYEEALAIAKEVLGSRHPRTAASLNNLADLYLETGAYGQAQPLLEEALGIRKEVLGSRHPETLVSLNNLAQLYKKTGAYGQAQPLLEDALRIRKEVLGPRHPDTAGSLNNLAQLYMAVGAYASAQPLLEEALAIRKAVLGPRHVDTATSLNNLAGLYIEARAYEQAKLLLEEALVTSREVVGIHHPETVTVLNSLGVLYMQTGAYAQAQSLLEEALAIRKAELGLRHPRTAVSLYNLAQLYAMTGAYTRAQPLIEEALAICHEVLGTDHPETADSLSSLAVLVWGQDQLVVALRHLRAAADINELNLRSLLMLGDESRKRAYMATLEGATSMIISFVEAAASHTPAAKSLGLEVVLQRKGRVLDVLAESLTRIRRSGSPEDQALWARYVASQTDWAEMTLRGPGPQPVDQYRARLDELAQQADKVATELSSRSSQFRAVLEPVTLAQVQRAIPPGAVLLEWVRYHPFNPKAIKLEPRWGEPRYAVYVLKSRGAPVFVDVGEAKALEQQVEKLLTVVRQPGRPQAMQALARDLYRQLIQPVQGHLVSATKLFLSPDGQLNLLPFGLLQGTRGRSLADQYELTYLTSGRDLLRSAIPAGVSGPSLLVADPAFDASIPATQIVATAASPRRSADIDRDGVLFNRLPGTAQEARDLSLLLNLAPSQVLTGMKATEAAVKQVQSPKILHLATHGFFLSNLSEAFPSTWRGVAVEFGERLPAPQGEHPLLRSGLALAGANQRQSGTDDGILTALEVANLDLTGTQLAVLSACETGVGDVRNGEGVYGLRRALVLAGVRTQVVSLWKVDDAATQAFMGHYYRSILNGMGRSAALRATQQKMRNDPKHPDWADPYYWAAFVVIGDSSPLPHERLSAATKERR